MQGTREKSFPSNFVLYEKSYKTNLKDASNLQDPLKARY